MKAPCIGSLLYERGRMVIDSGSFSVPDIGFTEDVLVKSFVNPSRHQQESSWLGNVFGALYTTIWGLAWYPQLIANHLGKSTSGFCYDLVVYNIYGFGLYSIYTCTQYKYQNDMGLEQAVDWQDVLFSLHSLAINFLYMLQAWYYDGRPLFMYLGSFCRTFILFTFGVIAMHVIAWILDLIPWVSVPGAIDSDGTIEAEWSVVECMGIIKAVITVIKYPTQIILNYDRQSTMGMSVMGFIMDLFGGVAALAQNGVDALLNSDITFITANLPKVIVAASSIFWDCVLIYQGAWLYRNKLPLKPQSRESALLPNNCIARLIKLFAPMQWPLSIEEPQESEVEMKKTRDSLESAIESNVGSDHMDAFQIEPSECDMAGIRSNRIE